MTNKKNILVLSDPPAAPGYLPRVRYLCDYLVRQGHQVTLLTEQYGTMDFVHSYPIVTIPMYSGGTIDWLMKTVWTLLTDWHNRAFAKKYLSGEAGRSGPLFGVQRFSFRRGPADCPSPECSAPLRHPRSGRTGGRLPIPIPSSVGLDHAFPTSLSRDTYSPAE